MRVYEAFETSERLAKEGRQCDIEFGGKVIATVVVRPADVSLNPDYRREMAELTVGLSRNLEDIDDDEDQERLWRLYVRSVIISWTWTDPVDKKDQKLRFNEKNALALFKRAPKFFQSIQRVAIQWSNYRAAHEEDAAGN